MLEIGENLRRARRARGLDLPAASSATCIRVRHLEALEADEFERLPAAVYARNFLREYAAFLGLDEELFVVEFDQRMPQPEAEMVARPSVARAMPARGLVPGRRAALVLGAAVIVAALWAVGRSSTPRPLAQPHRAPAAAAAAARVPATPAPRPVAAAPRVAVLSTPRGTTWLRLRRPDGRVLFEGIVPQGRTLRLGLTRPLLARLGAPWNVDLRVAGKQVALGGTRPVDLTLQR